MLGWAGTPRRVLVSHGPGGCIPPSLLDLSTVSVSTLRALRARGEALRRGDPVTLRTGAPVALLCGEPMPYVRAAIEAAAAQLGLRLVVYGPAEVARMGEAQVAGQRLGAMHAAVLVGGLPAEVLAAMASRSACPMVEAGGAGGDPAGALADLWVLEAALGGLAGRKLAWIGDACGLLYDLLLAGPAQGLSIAHAHPIGYAPDPQRVTWGRERAAVTGAAVLVTQDVTEAIAEAHAIYAEPWPEGAADRFRGFAVQRHALRGARGRAVVLHRYPEFRGQELSASLTEDGGWLAIEQSRSRVDAWGALLWWLLDPDPLRSVLRLH